VVGALNTPTTYSGQINDGTLVTAAQTTGAPTLGSQGVVALKKVGNSTLILDGTTANTYSMGTTISGGTLAITADNLLGAAYTGAVKAFTYTGNAATGGTPVANFSGGGGSGVVSSISVASNFYFDVSNGGSGYTSNPTVTVTGATNTPIATARVIGLLTLDGGTLRTDAAMTSNRAVVITSNGGTIDTNGVASTFSGVFNNGGAGSGGLTVKNSGGAGGKLTLTGTNTYAGVTTVQGGTLLVNGANTGAGAVVANSGATLGGTGSIAGAVTIDNGAKLAPGASIGTLTVGSFQLLGNMSVEYDDSASPQKIDVTTSLGAVDLTALTSGVTFLPIGAPLTAPAYIFVNYGSLSGTFASTSGLPSGYTIDYNYLGGNSIALVAAVPEASSFLALGLAGLIAGGYRLRKKTA
jgi:autotransporter-associated beta strand protein